MRTKRRWYVSCSYSLFRLPTCILFCRTLTLAYPNTVLSYPTRLPTCILFCRTLPACLPVHSSVVPYLLAYCILFCRTVPACLPLYTVLSYPTRLPTCLLFCRTLPACLPVYCSVVPYLLAYLHTVLSYPTCLHSVVPYLLAYLYTVLSYPIEGRAFGLISRPVPNKPCGFCERLSTNVYLLTSLATRVCFRVGGSE